MDKSIVRLSQAFLVIFIISIPLGLYGVKYRTVISNSSFFQAMNSIFVTDYGVLWLSGAFWSHTLCICLPEKFQSRILINRLLKYTLYLIFGVFFNAWFFGPSLVERLNVATGGHCAGSEELLQSMSQCRGNPLSSWVDGFDLSGHYFFLITSSSVLLDAISRRNAGAGTGANSNEQNCHKSMAQKLLQMATTLTTRFAMVLITVWLVEFCVTSIFFHTVWEKASGLLGIPVGLMILALSDKICGIKVAQEQYSAV
ncbi:hypothetical protein JCM33374_g4951 [Metschnikowia sp. JCM 33374]|nr:hypothetical protein JCM33374_g4951 [Metschnikowia sp. JCM 33374]